MIHIRPYQLFEKVSGTMTVPIPKRSSRESQSVTLLETAVLISLVRLVNAKSLVEIGTCRGVTTLNLLINTDVQIISIDIERQPRDYDGTKYASRVSELLIDTKNFTPEPESTDFVFVDADHTMPAAMIDSKHAHSMARKCIAWHDYQNPLYPELAAYLNSIPNLYHIEDTQIAFWLKDRL